MLHFFVCDDDDKYLHMITKCLHNNIDFEEYDIDFALSTKDPSEVIEYVKQNTVNGLYFLDIEFACGYNGVDVARQIREHDPRGFIVFVTAHENYMQLTFDYKVEPLDYIRKSDNDEVRKRICECIKSAYKKYVTRQNDPSFVFKSKGGRRISCLHNQILYFETDAEGDKRIIMHTEKRPFVFYDTLKNVAANLSSGLFFDCHKSYIVNISKITKEGVLGLKTGKPYVTMPNYNRCYVASRKRRQLIKLVAEYQNKGEHADSYRLGT